MSRLFGRGPALSREDVLEIAYVEARRRGWSWERPRAFAEKKGFYVRLRGEEMESPFVRVSARGQVREVGFDDRYGDQELSGSDDGFWND